MRESYFQSYDKYFWEWEESGQIFATIPGGSTIAYREFLFEVIIKLAPQGLPPFGSLLLAIISTNSNGASLAHVKQIFSGVLAESDEAMLDQAIAFMQLMYAVPDQYKKGDKRVLFLQAIFEGCHNALSLKDSAKIAEDCRKGPVNFGRLMIKEGFLMGTFRYDFRTLALLTAKFKTVDDIINKMGALPALPQLEIEFEETPKEVNEPLDLVDQLIKNDKTFTTGSLIKWLWGGLDIPVHSMLPSQQPIGGVSDLTNKGDFDKLLISEFAYDDITFMSRLANNEALFIHREIPPVQNDLNRIILIDASLKNWGTPKTIAFAVMLAIVRHPKTDIACHAYVLGENYFPVSTETVHDIIDGLQIVEPGLHAGLGLEAFFRDHGTDKNKEVFLITEETTLKHPDMLRVMNEFHQGINYLVLTNSEGEIDLYRRHQGARKHLQHIKVPLNQLWQRTKREAPLPEPRQNSDDGIPILLKSPGAPKKIISAPDGEIFQLTSEMAILKLFDRGSKKVKGWELMCQDASVGTLHFEMGLSPSNDYIALLYNHNRKEITLINLLNREKKTYLFNHWRSTAWPSFIFRDGKFFHANQLGAWSIALDGKIESVTSPGNDVFRQRQEALLEVAKLYTTNSIVFKNIHNVYINGSGKLVLNIHELRLNSQGSFRLDAAQDKNVLISAAKNRLDEFSFPDGSVVEANRAGFIVLRSSDTRIAPIYIPTAMDGTLCAATFDRFAGNKYYYKHDGVRVIFHLGQAKKLEAVKMVATLVGMSLTEAKTIVDTAPCRIDRIFIPEVAKKLKADFYAIGATLQLQESVDSGQEAVTMDSFYNAYIGRFIKIITDHGA